jgi:hypothetical protein
MADTITPLLGDLLDCVCTQLATDGRAVCECCQVVSDILPPMTGCDCVCAGGQGRAWIRLVQAQWSQQRLEKCPTGWWELDIQVGVYRCITDHAGSTSCLNATADAVSVAADLASISKALFCCAALQAAAKWRLGAGRVVGPDGGCVGATIDLTVQIGTIST